MLPVIVKTIKELIEQVDSMMTDLKIEREKRELLESASKVAAGKPIEVRKQGAKEIEDQFNNLSKL